MEPEASCFSPTMEQGVCYPPATGPGYMYLGYDGTCPQLEGRQRFVSQGRLPHSQPHLSSARYTQPVGSHLPETLPVYSWDTKPGAEDSGTKEKSANASGRRTPFSGVGSRSSTKYQQAMKSEIKLESKTSPRPLDTKPRELMPSSDCSCHSIKPFKVPQMSPAEPVKISREYLLSAKMSTHRGQNFSFPRSNFSVSRSAYPVIQNNYHIHIKKKSNLQRGYGAPIELVRGPRAARAMSFNSPRGKDSLSSNVRRDQYNKPDFQIKYEQAKFFMIKSYSEDDIHKSIKYRVWASTPNGNKKLDAAFRKAEIEKTEKGVQCPIFLFFSVNASAQFVGLAEMTGPVDFKKNMDFWQQDKWNGFFPVRWHIIKDIPNKLFQHITLENNDNKAVTFSRDTQEIKLPQGLSMLQIFKAYQSETSMLDDFEFYEENERLLLTRRDRPAAKPSNLDVVDDGSMKHLESSFGRLSTSERSRKPYFMSRHPPSNFTRRPYVNSPLPMT